jgi:RNA polymerase sigma-70 factor (ECF subfamily)
MTGARDFNQELITMLPRLRRFGFVLARRQDVADDLVQDTCERAIQRAAQFEPGTRFDSWLFAIMQSIWRNRLRADRVRAADGEEALAGVADSVAHMQAESQVALSDVERSLLELPNEQREVLLLVGVEGHSYKEAADLLELPVGTIMSRLSRGRLALTKAHAL